MGNNSNKMYDLYFSAFGSIISALIGILGTYFGAIYVGKKAIEAVQKQLDKHEQDKIDKKKENRETVIKIIVKLFKEEIIDNKKLFDDIYLFI